jgi:hypothetical protein
LRSSARPGPSTASTPPSSMSPPNSESRSGDVLLTPYLQVSAQTGEAQARHRCHQRWRDG